MPYLWSLALSLPRAGVALCLAASCAAAAHAGEVHVAVAANFAAPMARIAEAFAAATGHSVKLSSGATGKFYAQIVAGAPFELLLAADDETPKRLVDEGHAVAGSRFTYATGRLVLWSATPGFVDEQGAVLGAGRFAHLAIANPKLAPYGRRRCRCCTRAGWPRRWRRSSSPARASRRPSSSSAPAMPSSASSRCRRCRCRASRPVGSGWRVPESLHDADPAGRGAAEARRSATRGRGAAGLPEERRRRRR